MTERKDADQWGRLIEWRRTCGDLWLLYLKSNYPGFHPLAWMTIYDGYKQLQKHNTARHPFISVTYCSDTTVGARREAKDPHSNGKKLAMPRYGPRTTMRL